MIVMVEVLGGMRARTGTDVIELGGPRQRRALLAIALGRGSVVSDGAIINAVWEEGDELPADPSNTVQLYVSRLRRLLGSDCILTDGSGYRLGEGVELDADHFDRAVRVGRNQLRQGDIAGVLGSLQDGLALWRGDAFGDLAGVEAARAEVARLDELRVNASELLGEARLAQDPQSALPDLEALAALHPLREGPALLLARAREATGQRVEALRGLAEFRSHLLETSGVDPTAAFDELESQVLDGSLPNPNVATRALRGYELAELVGEGAFGSIFRAKQPTVGRDVAVKVVKAELADDPQFIRRFEAEAQMVARLEHPHIVPLHDYWREPGGAYLVMRYLRGGSAEQRLVADGPLTTAEASQVVEEIGGALAFAHSRGVIHRDVKPANILFDETGNSYLTDFGIAVRQDAKAELDLRSAGSPVYVSPEQVRDGVTTPSSDIYALGVVLYELFTGLNPFPDATSIAQLLDQKTRSRVPLINGQRPDVPGAVDLVLQRATSPTPGERFPDIGEMVIAFRAATGSTLPGSTTTSDPASATERPRSRASQTLVSLEMEAVNPYKGLAAFQEADTDEFFGREELTGRLHEHLQNSRFLAVVGPSGSGKSSVVRAGLVPRLRDDSTYVVQIAPGRRPMHEVETGLLRIAADSIPTLLDQLEADVHGLSRAINRCLPETGGELLLVLDQFEELFTLTSKEERDAFLAAVHAAVTDDRSRVRVVATIRADFYDRPLAHASISDLFQANTVAVTPLSAEELDRAISGPAERLGVSLEPTLVAELVSQTAASAGALPLLQFVLTELFERREGGRLTLESYRELGGIEGAIAHRADQVFADVGEPDAVRRLFTRLITPGEGAEDTRRRVELAELGGISSDVIDAFGGARLLAFDRDPVTREPTVEVAHEALIREWPRLRAWLDDDRDGLRVLRHLGASAAAWETAGRDPGELYRGGRLEGAQQYAGRHEADLNDDERTFLQASIDLSEAEAANEARSRRRLRGLLVGVGIVAVIALIASAVAFQQRGSARTSRDAALAAEETSRAEQQIAEDARDAESVARAAAEDQQARADAARQEADLSAEVAETRRIVADAAAVVADNPDLGLLLAAEAHRRDPGPATLAGLLRVLTGSGPLLGTLGAGETFGAARYLDDDHIVALTDTEIVHFEVDTGQEISRTPLPGPLGSTGGSATFDTVGGVVAVALEDGSLWLSDESGSRQLGLPDESIFRVAISPDGASVVLSLESGNLAKVNVATGTVDWKTQVVLNSSYNEVLSPEALDAYPWIPRAFDPVVFQTGPALATFDGDTVLVPGGVDIHRLDLATGEIINSTRLLSPLTLGLPEIPRASGRVVVGPESVFVQAGLDNVFELANDFSSASGVLLPSSVGDLVDFTVGIVVTPSGEIWAVTSSGKINHADRFDELDRASIFATTQPLVTDVAMSPDAGEMLIAGTRGIVRRAINGDRLLGRGLPTDQSTRRVVVDDRGEVVVVGTAYTADPNATAWNLSGEQPQPFPPIPGYEDDLLTGIQVRPGQRNVLTTTIALVDGGSAADVAQVVFADTLELAGPPIFDVSIPWANSPDGLFQAVPYFFRPEFRVVSLPDFEQVSPNLNFSEWADGNVQAGDFAFDPMRPRLVAVVGSGTTLVYSSETWELERIIPPEESGGISALAYAADADVMVTRSFDGAIVQRDPETFEVIKEFAGATSSDANRFNGPYLSPEGEYFLTNRDNVPRLWHLPSGTQIGSFPANVATLSGGSTGAEGLQLGTLVDDFAVVWNLDVDTWPGIACVAVGRNMTPEEWEQFGPVGAPYEATCRQWPGLG